MTAITRRVRGWPSRFRPASIRRSRRDRAGALDLGELPSAEATALISEDRRRVLAGLRRLPARQREALVCRFYLELSEEETARVMGVSRGTVKSTTSRAVAALGRMLREGLCWARAARRARARRRLSWGAPVLAAVAVVAVAVALVIVRNTPNGRVPSPASSATSATPVNPTGIAGVPEYYVAWVQADRPYLDVRNTWNGGLEGIVPPPDGIYLNGVYGTAADDRTFIVTGTRVPAPGTTVWYLLRLRQGDTPMSETPLPIPVPQDPAGVALSPDGTQVAVALNGSQPRLRVYSVATGALLHSWPAPSGKFAAVKASADSWQYTQLTLRWREPECAVTAAPGDGAYIGWANADASVLIGSLVWDGHVRFGIFRGNRFTPLPKLPVSMPTPAGVLIGTDAW